MILRFEDAPLMTYEEATEFVRAQQQANPPRPRKIWP
jgi:hypothetical protein